VDSPRADRARQEQADRHRGAGRQARDTSRAAYRSQNAAQAQSLARRTYPRELSGRVYNGADFGPNLQVVKRAGRSGAIVADAATGKRFAAVSTLPLLADNGVPVDLSLGRSAHGFSPHNPLVRVTIDDHLAQGVSLTNNDLSVALQSPADPSPVETDDRVYFANVDTDSDYFVVPQPRGFESFLVLRSQDSPERFVMKVDLPLGATLRKAVSKHPIPNDPPESLEVFDITGKSLAFINPPHAYDADGAPVPITMHAEGANIVLDVPHRSGDWHYPLLADPTVSSYVDGSTGTPDCTPNTTICVWPGWWWHEDQQGGPSTFGVNVEDCAYYCGLYTSMPTHTNFNSGAFSEFYAHAPAGTYIYKWGIGNWGYQPVTDYNSGQLASQSVLEMLTNSFGYEPNATWSQTNSTSGNNPLVDGPYTVADYTLSTTFCVSGCAPTSGTEQNYALIMLQATRATYTNANKAYVGMGSGTQFLGDRNNPSFTSGVPGDHDWYDDGGAGHPVWTNLHDDGLGDYSVGLAGAAGGNTTVYADTSCGDPYQRHCPGDWAPTFNYTLSEGVNTLTLTGRDVVDNATSRSWTEKVDRTPPAITGVSGSLTTSPTVDSTGSYTLHVNATDGDGSSNASARSGGKQVEVRISDANGTRSLSSPVRSCPAGSCALSEDFTITSADLGDEGTKTISVRARDQLDHWSSYSNQFQVVADGSPPLANISGTLAGSDGATLGSGSYSLVVEADDSTSSGVSVAGIKEIKITVNGTTVFDQTPSCSPTCPTTLTTSPWSFVAGNAANQYGDGRYEVIATVIDASDYRSEQAVVFDVAHASSLASQNLTVNSSSGLQIVGELPNDKAGASIANVGDVNGDGFADLLVGAPGASCSGATGSGAAYLVYGAANQGTVNLSSLNPAVVKYCGSRSGDAAGTSVGAAGDVNGDGVPDLVIGTPGRGTAGVPGHAYVVFGSTSLSNATLNAALIGGFEITGPVGDTIYPALVIGGTTAAFGSAVSNVPDDADDGYGDVNGDGLDDVVIGDPIASQSSGRLESGAAFVVFGKADPAPVTADGLASSGRGFAIWGAQQFDQGGTGVTLAGDTNGDGRSEIALTAPWGYAAASGGAAFVVFGKAAAADVDLVSTTTGSFTGGYRIVGCWGAMQALAPAGDVTGDGVPDLLIGGQYVYAVPGQSTIANHNLCGETGWFTYRAMAPSDAGNGPSLVPSYGGDIDVDGTPDALITSTGSNSGAGAVYVVYGAPYNWNSGTPIVDLDSLAGDDGTRVNMPAGSQSRSATAVDQGGGDHAVVAGRQGASSSRGQASSEPVGQFQEVQGDKQCAGSGYFQMLAAPHAMHRCRYGYYRTRDKSRKDLNNYGAARKRIAKLPSNAPIDLLDSYGTVIGTMKMKKYGCFEIDPTGGGGFETVDTSVGNNTTCADTKPAQIWIEINGPGCMATSAPGGNFDYLRILLREPDTKPGHTPLRPTGAGLMFFIRTNQAPPNAQPGGAWWSQLTGAAVGCGKSPRHARTQGHVLSSMSSAGGFLDSDRYLNRLNNPAKTDKYATFENHSGFDNYIAIEVSTSSVAVGGIMQALVPRTDEFVQDDYMTKPDSNVPCDDPRLALWHHGSVKHAGTVTNIHGWVPTREPESFDRKANDSQCP
jgi:hypothetical protein